MPSSRGKARLQPCLPSTLLIHALGYLRLCDLSTAGVACREWACCANQDVLWLFWYLRRFGEAPPPPEAATAPEIAAEAPEQDILAVLARQHPLPGPCSGGRVRAAYKERSDCPFVNDLVEVAWRGRFRLENSKVLGGTSWWEARVVSRPSPGSGGGGGGSGGSGSGRFRIHYLAWDERWDENIKRSRMRWPLDPSDVAELRGPKDVGKNAEVWCRGTHVRGAWLVAPVRKACYLPTGGGGGGSGSSPRGGGDGSSNGSGISPRGGKNKAAAGHPGVLQVGLGGVLPEGGKKTVVWVDAVRCRRVLSAGEGKAAAANNNRPSRCRPAAAAAGGQAVAAGGAEAVAAGAILGPPWDMGVHFQGGGGGGGEDEGENGGISLPVAAGRRSASSLSCCIS